MDTKFRSALKGICSGDLPAALVTIIRVKGSTPRKPGAKMLILPDGQVFGTIGGGCGEAEVKRTALIALDTQKPGKYTVNMTNEVAEEEGMVCGGIMEVFIDILGHGADEGKKLISAYLNALENNEEPVLATVTDSKLAETHPGQKKFINFSGVATGELGSDQINQLAGESIKQVRRENKPLLLDEPQIQLFFEPPNTQMKLLILGGGHISLPLSNMAKITGYHVTVVDDRPSFANTSRFTNIDRVICDDFVQAIRQINIDTNTSVVIVTRGHRHDKLCLCEVIGRPASYIGMIGSKRRVKALMSELTGEGIPITRLQKIHAPIGLDIGAEIPEEIAVSILAEIISVHRR